MTPIRPICFRSKARAYTRRSPPQQTTAGRSGKPAFCPAGQHQPPSVRPGEDATGPAVPVASARNAEEVHDEMTPPVGPADPGGLLATLSISAALAQRAARP